MKKMRRRKSIDPVLGFHWYLQFGGTEEEATWWICKKYNIAPLPSSPTHNGCFISIGLVPYAGMIWIRGDCGVGIMAHEVAHAVVHVCRVLQLDPREADEFQASYAGYLMKELNKISGTPDE